jgi:hypothetical protein
MGSEIYPYLYIRHEWKKHIPVTKNYYDVTKEVHRIFFFWFPEHALKFSKHTFDSSCKWVIFTAILFALARKKNISILISLTVKKRKSHL